MGIINRRRYKAKVQGLRRRRRALSLPGARLELRRDRVSLCRLLPAAGPPEKQENETASPQHVSQQSSSIEISRKSCKKKPEKFYVQTSSRYNRPVGLKRGEDWHLSLREDTCLSANVSRILSNTVLFLLASVSSWFHGTDSLQTFSPNWSGGLSTPSPLSLRSHC